MKRTTMKAALSLIPAFAAFLWLCGVATAQSQVKGPISGRSGPAAEGQADNRRVVVRILQNKGIAGN